MASEITTWLEGFVYRGKPPWATDEPAWHVEIGRCLGTGEGGREMLPALTLTPAQAEAAGFPLSAVLSGIDAAALAGRDAALAEAEAARRERDAAVSERDALAAQLAGREPAPAAALSAVSDRQFFQALALAGAIDPAEALAAVMTGTLPARIDAAVTALPEAEQFAARMLLSGATAFERGHPMVAQLGAALGYDAAALDALWREAAAL